MAAVECPRFSTIAATLVLFVTGAMFAPVPMAYAQDARLISHCGPLKSDPEAQPAAANPAGTPAAQLPAYTVTCAVRSTEPAEFQSVKVTAKGRSEPLAATFKAFDPHAETLSVLFMLQIVEPQRARTAQQMADAVLKIAEARDGNRRFAAYSFANDLNLLAGFDAGKPDFDRAVRAQRPVALPTQLYQNVLEAIDRLAKENSERKAIIILGDGNSDDTGYEHDQVVKAAKQAGVVIHALGFVETAADLPKFQLLRRLADDTGGFRREIRFAREGRFEITPKFARDVLENGGTVKISLREPPGPLTVTLNADLGNGRSDTADHTVTIPEPPKPPAETTTPQPAPPQTLPEKAAAWLRDNHFIGYAIGIGFLLASLGFLLFAFGRRRPAPVASTAAGGPKNSQGIVYGWLEMLDGNATRHPLNMTNVRIGRHRDNDVCLQNDSISRRHAVLHYNADHKRFVITDLGTQNGVVVNNVRQNSHELSDGDLIELGEVRLRFRANMEFVA